MAPHSPIPAARYLEVEGLGAFEKGADLLQRLEPLGLERHDLPPMIPNSRPLSGSFYVGITFPVQAHVSLEEAGL